MQDVQALLYEMENELNKQNNIEKFPLLLDKINILFLKVAASKDIDEANQYFDLLGLINGLVCQILFLDKLKVPYSLWKLFEDFDRIDTAYLRSYYFNELKGGRYLLSEINLEKNNS